MRATLIMPCLVIAGVACQDAGEPLSLESGSTALAHQSPTAAQVAGDWVFRSERLVGNDLTHEAGTIRDVDAAGKPWIVERGSARLNQRGELRVSVRGLVLAENGRNPAPSFTAKLSCLTEEEGALVPVLRAAAPVVGDSDGDAQIRASLSDLPSPCYAPIVFVTVPNGNWVAVAGF